jgi:asparagine synthase (glutamine-hydrolysing)
MFSGDRSVCLLFNGEIYNFRELREELTSRGYRFNSTGDTEVALRAYERWGPDFLTHLDGMFAIAVWDASRQRLLLARDRAGKKPLFYAIRNGRLTFASEVKALARAPWIRLDPALEHIPRLLTFGYVPAPDTVYRGVRQVAPATAIDFFPSEDRVVERQYWSALPTLPPVPAAEDSQSRIRELLASAVRRRMVSDVPIGALLSGGVDSSLVTTLMVESSSEPVATFSVGFPDDQSYD